MTDRGRPRDPVGTAGWALAVPLPLVAVCGVHGVVGTDAATVWQSVLLGVRWGLVLVAGLAVVVLVALALSARGPFARRGGVRPWSQPTWRAVGVVGYFVLLTSVASRLTPLPVFDVFERHWQGKVLDLLWLVVLFGVLHRWARTEAGLRWHLERGSLRPAMIMVGTVFGLFVALTVVSILTGAAPLERVSVEQFAHDATLPNLTEELIWRGAMLAVLTRAFGAPRTVAGAPVGWGVVITAVVFGLGHTVLVDASGMWGISVAGGLFALVMGLLLGWIRARTGSIWPAFLLHCAPEVGVDVGMLLLGT